MNDKNDEKILSLEEAFKLADKIKQKRKYTTEEVIALTHEYRNRYKWISKYGRCKPTFR